MEKFFQTTREDYRIAWLAALAITLHVSEAVIPMPLPGLKPGISNIVTVVVLCQMGLQSAFWVTLLRVVVGSVVLGTFLSPTFVLSASGAICGLLGLATCYLYNKVNPRMAMGPLGYSVMAAMCHMLGQLISAYFLFIPHDGLLKLAPALLIASLVFGLLNGFISQKTLIYLNK